MEQIITLWADGRAEISSKGYTFTYPSASLGEVNQKIEEIFAVMKSAGIYTLHSERGELNQFEHVTTASGVDALAFGATVSVVDFDFLTSSVDAYFLSLAQSLMDFENSPDGVRLKRNLLLSETDWTQIADAPVNQTLWAAYRQSLRDVPQQAGFPYSVDWPKSPVDPVE